MLKNVVKSTILFKNKRRWGLCYNKVSNMIAYNWIRVPHFYILIVSNISFLIDMFFYRKKGGQYMKAYLILEDGNVFEGESVGANKEVVSEFVFNTSISSIILPINIFSLLSKYVLILYL